LGDLKDIDAKQRRFDNARHWHHCHGEEAATSDGLPRNHRCPPPENAMIDPPQIVQSAQQRTAAVHVTVARAGIAQAFSPAVAELMTALREQGIAATGPLISYHLTMPSENFDFDIALPVDQEVAATGGVFASDLPAMTTVARCVYRGPMEGVGAAWGELRSWMAANGHAARPLIWERYLVDPGTTPDPAAWQTELNWPVEGE
jgi:effector-binding domain-containing protein